MIDHTGLHASNPEKSRAFYDQALAPLGYKLLAEIPKEFTGGLVVLGYGEPPKPDFWVAEGTAETPKVHIAIRAAKRLSDKLQLNSRTYRPYRVGSPILMGGSYPLGRWTRS